VKRILMTADAVGGVWTYALELAAALAPHGYETHLAVLGPRMTPRQERAAAAAPGIATLRHGDFALEWMPDPWEQVDRAGDWLLGLAEQLQPDVVHLNGYAHAALPWGAPVVVVAHSCVLSWWSAVRGGEAPAEWDTYRCRVAAGLAAADSVVAPTRAMLDELWRYGVPRGTVVPNCRGAGWVRPASKEPMVLGAGRIWDEAKNLHLLEAVAPRLPWPVRIASGLPFEELAGLLARAAVFAAPASYEPFGLGPLEAGLAGCALVLADIPSLREVWGDAALYVPPRDGDALAGALALLAADTRLRERLAAAARGRAATYDPARTAAGYLTVYDSLRSVPCAS
jgi:glycogen synthase